MSNPYKNLKEPTADVGSEDLAAALLLLAKSHAKLAGAVERLADLAEACTISGGSDGMKLLRLMLEK